MSPAELFALPFMQRALLAAMLTGLAAPAIGTYLVQRRLALMGDGIGHIAVTGVALGLLTGAAPALTALIVATVGAIVIDDEALAGHEPGDRALGADGPRVGQADRRALEDAYAGRKKR